MTAIHSAEKPLSTEAIAKIANIPRITAKKYLEELEEKEKVESARSGKAVYWWLRVKHRGAKGCVHSVCIRDCHTAFAESIMCAFP